MFSKILIANRGEVAVRVIRACKEMGVQTVAVYSTADRDALHVNLADESICVGEAPVSASYLNADAILSAAICTNVDAIHPGYGLLSENARFAELCEKCGIRFIGPSSDTIRRMGDKEEARREMREAGLPVIPGSEIVRSFEEAKRAAEEIGYPLMCKARAGGGGRGIRIVESEADLQTALRLAEAEAQSAFGDGSVYLERYLNGTKHIEVQILADAHGTVLHLGERDCSVQRRRQKMVEESPAPVLDKATRQAMFDAAVKCAETVGYLGAGTVEFLLDSDGRFYFLEMNTRLQVEHPVSEAVTGLDLVKWQIRIAAEAALPMPQERIRVRGHAIECRIIAENPSEDFRPSAGKITELHVPGGPWVRFDSAIYQGYIVPPYYDSMIGKLIVHAQTREEAIRKMRAALCELVIVGVDHNTEYLMDILENPMFMEGTHTTSTFAHVPPQRS